MHATPTATKAGPIIGHISATAAIATPIAIALLSQMAMGLTDTIMLGGLGAQPLAAGGLGASLFFTSLITLQGVLSSAAVLTARANGAGHKADVPCIYWSGMALATVLALPMWLLMSHPGPLLHAAGETPELIRSIATYLHVLRWGVPAGVIGIGMMRGFLPAIGLQRLMLWVIPAGIFLNAGLNVLLIYGGLGLPAYGMRGSAAATAITLWISAVALFALLHGGRHRYLVAPTRPRWPVIAELLSVGLPVGVTVVVEAGLFMVTALLVGVLGPVPLAAHTVAVSVASTTFMVPLAISQAANVRVAQAAGGGHVAASRRAGYVAIAMSAAFMGCAALLLELAPHVIVSLYVATASPSAPLAARLLRVAGGFQVVDGVQTTAAGALRGLKDTRVPMLLAAFGYWAIGFMLGRTLAFSFGMGVVGLWWGLSAGLAAVALSLTARFALLENQQKTGAPPTTQAK